MYSKSRACTSFWIVLLVLSGGILLLFVLDDTICEGRSYQTVMDGIVKMIEDSLVSIKERILSLCSGESSIS